MGGKGFGSFAELGYPGAVLFLLLVAAVGWYGWRPLFRTAEANFWSLNALAVQPGYALCREALRHVAEQSLGERSTVAKLARLRAICSAGAGVVVCALAGLVAFLVWPATRWVGTVTDILSPQSLLVPTLANAVVVVSIYLAGASLVWGFADASMDQPRDIRAFDAAPSAGRSGGSPISPISTWSASATVSASKAGVVVRGATIAWGRFWLASRPCIWPSHWISSSSPEI